MSLTGRCPIQVMSKTETSITQVTFKPPSFATWALYLSPRLEQYYKAHRKMNQQWTNITSSSTRLDHSLLTSWKNNFCRRYPSLTYKQNTVFRQPALLPSSGTGNNPNWWAISKERFCPCRHWLCFSYKQTVDEVYTTWMSGNTRTCTATHNVAKCTWQAGRGKYAPTSCTINTSRDLHPNY